MIAILVAVSFMLLGSVFLYQVNRFAVQQKTAVLERCLSKMVVETENYIKIQTDFNEEYLSSKTMRRFVSMFEQNMKRLASECDGAVFIADPDGRIAFQESVKESYLQLSDALPKTVSDSVKSNGAYSGVSTLGGYLSKSSFVMGAEITDEYYAFVASPADQTIELFASLSRIFIIMTVLVLAISLLIATLCVRTIVKPIKEMAEAARSFGRGDYSARVRVPKQKDELYELAVSFNNMADSVENAEISRRGLVANVSHDLRTPMTTIAGFVDGIIDGTIKPDKQEYYLKIVSDEIKRLSRLATSMLELSKLESNDNTFSMRQFDISEIVRRIIISFEKKLSDKNVEVELDIPDKLDVVANHDAMFQVIYNLIDNAVKFVDENGRISVALSEKNGRARFKVANTGSIISEEDAKRVFERFYKADTSRTDSKNGSGLGLYIVKTIVNRHDGDVAVNSTDEQTEFSFNIPVKPAEKAKSAN
ncbi:MAG: HAMP domain-containing histidine kinase [Clostridia bacterium]|nr:HAMP domain-containing histidine kinase [Clostridia bacterium]